MVIVANVAIPVNPQNSRRPGFFTRVASWLFSQKHFHFKLLSGTTAGAIVIIFLAGVFLYVTLRNHYQDALRAHTIAVMRMSGLIENDLAAMEAATAVFC